MRVFYVVYFDGIFGAVLDLARLLCRPDAKNRAHVTVRGPYDGLRDLSSESATIFGAPITLAGVGQFSGPEQSTVYLPVTADALKSVWDKPDYGYVPHVTIFDRYDPEFALLLHARLKACDICLSAPPILGLEPLISETVPVVRLRDRYNPGLTRRLFGGALTLAEIDQLSPRVRVDLVGNLLSAMTTAQARR